MFNRLSTLLAIRQPAVKAGPMLHGQRLERSRMHNGQFLSYLENRSFRRIDPTRHERSMRQRKIALKILSVGAVLAFAWVIRESAHALSMF